MIFIHMYLGYVLIMFLYLATVKTIGDNRHTLTKSVMPPESVGEMGWNQVFLLPVLLPILLPALVGVALYASFAKENTKNSAT